jgi:hypothetical protein
MTEIKVAYFLFGCFVGCFVGCVLLSICMAYSTVSRPLQDSLDLSIHNL